MNELNTLPPTVDEKELPIMEFLDTYADKERYSHNTLVGIKGALAVKCVYDVAGLRKCTNAQLEEWRGSSIFGDQAVNILMGCVEKYDQVLSQAAAKTEEPENIKGHQHLATKQWTTSQNVQRLHSDSGVTDWVR